jgi:hypothetical protein
MGWWQREARCYACCRRRPRTSQASALARPGCRSVHRACAAPSSLRLRRRLRPSAALVHSRAQTVRGPVRTNPRDAACSPYLSSVARRSRLCSTRGRVSSYTAPALERVESRRDAPKGWLGLYCNRRCVSKRQVHPRRYAAVLRQCLASGGGGVLPRCIASRNLPYKAAPLLSVAHVCPLCSRPARGSRCTTPRAGRPAA